MEAPWAYHYAGRPDRTAEVVHAGINNMFGVGRGGLPGNDDSGGLSSWYVWASLGLFPIAGQSLYLINAPSFAESRLALADKELVIDAAGFIEPVADGPAQYVQSAIFNGETLSRTWLTARELHRGGHLRLQLGPRPSAWGSTTDLLQPHMLLSGMRRPPRPDRLEHQCGTTDMKAQTTGVRS
jgi:putative alpha-1,2-mannosidase